jgi:tRNA nucleotidyltransferase/poly(A) polymerase
MLEPPAIDPRRDFALEVVRKLKEHGYQALWAGGCVRDELLGKLPKDYDVATDAVPEKVRAVFRRRRTLAIGAAFGVISVVGSKAAGQVDVATFREDLEYRDGRRPSSVSYSTPEQDALRRDFTINGIFFDPLTGDHIDFVGGKADLEAGIVRAIGEPAKRFTEDKLRMLRAVRFSASLGFELEARTRLAATAMACELAVVSPERIAAELRRMLVDENRVRAVEMLRDTGQLEVIFPELEAASTGEFGWPLKQASLSALSAPGFPLALATLLRGLPVDRARDIGLRLRLSNHEVDRLAWLIQCDGALTAARKQPWPRVQRLLTEPGIEDLLALHDAVATAEVRDRADSEFCHEVLARPRGSWDPPPLVGGDELKQAGIPPGSIYRQLLNAVRDAQLLGQIHSPDEAIALAQRLAGGEPSDR